MEPVEEEVVRIAPDPPVFHAYGNLEGFVQASDPEVSEDESEGEVEVSFPAPTI